MTLIERLRDLGRYDDDDLLIQAADEIERLQSKLTQAQQAEQGAVLEIERLTAALKTANANHERFEREWYLRGDEIERLTACVEHHQAVEADQERAIERLREVVSLDEKELERLEGVADSLRDDITWLKAALAKSCEEGRDEMYDCGYNRLRSALETAHDVLANGGDLKTDTYQTRCNRALAITREALRDE